jgi:hypothetical protein
MAPGGAFRHFSGFILKNQGKSDRIWVKSAGRKRFCEFDDKQEMNAEKCGGPIPGHCELDTGWLISNTTPGPMGSCTNNFLRQGGISTECTENVVVAV